MATTAKQTTTSNSSASSVRNSSATVTLQSSHQQHYQHTTSQLVNITSSTTSSTHHRATSRSISPIQINNNNNNNNQYNSNHQIEQDIEIIAKQISDQAEAIYQTWKARNLAPTEILTCHPVSSASAFDKTLTPSISRSSVSSITSSRRSESPPQLQQRIVHTINDLRSGAGGGSGLNHIDHSEATSFTNAATMSNSNLKKLVSTFVSEDKARQQQQQQQQQQSARKSNILTSGTIKDALRKFENIDSSNAPNIRPNYLKYNSANSAASNNRSQNNNSSSISTTVTAQAAPTNATTIKSIAQREKSPKLQLDQTQNEQLQSQSSNSYESSKLNKNVPDVLINTIEQDKLSKSGATKSLSNSSTNNTSSAATTPVKVKPETPAKPANLLNHQPAFLSFKNRLKTVENGSNSNSGTTNGNCTKTSTVKAEKAGESSTKSLASVPAAYENDIKSVKLVKQNCQSSANKTADLMDEVLMEEERLINALKTGTVLNNDKVLPEVITSTLNNTNSNINNNNNSNSTTINTMTNVKIVTAANANADQAQPQQRNNWNGSGPKSAPIELAKPSEAPINELDGVQLKFTKTRTKNDAAVPHPANSAAGRNPSSVPAVRPFLTRGSVAERVLMFEKCPEIKALRGSPKEVNKVPVKPVPKPQPEQQTCTTLQRTIRNTKNVYIPRFHFPYGKPLPSITLEQTLSRLSAAFDSYPNNAMSKDDFVSVLKICQLPFYWRMPLINCTQLTPAGLVEKRSFCDFWKQMSVFCHDAISRFVFIMSRGQRSRPYILPEDLVCLVQDVVDTHPGLAFLKEAAEFHSRYVHTVIARIFYAVNRSWSGKITMAELRRSDLLQVLQLLEEEEDINQIMAYFSYEHFYVIYCKFWELDRDHDLFIDQNDLSRHNDHALSTRIIERIFSGCVTKVNKVNNQRMSYTEFVWFLLSEEDKSHATAVEYWFRCMDLDGDGILSMYELEYFYEEQQHRMESIGIETLPFEDCLCQMLDMIKPTVPGCITLSDLKRCKMTPIFFDTFFNLEKYMEHEQRDPFASQREDEMSDWDRYAAQEYELLVAEEGGDTQGSYDDEDDYESNIDILESHLDDQMSGDINEL